MSVPKLRFRADDGTEFPEWKEKTFSEILSENKIPIPKPTNGYERLGIRSHGKGTFHECVPAGEGLDVDTMYVVEAHNLILNITFAWEQAIAVTDDKDDGKLVSHRFPQYKFNDGFNWHYFKYDILDKKLKHELGLASPGGAGRNRVLNKSDFLKIKRVVPCLNEQRKIADFLSTIDEIIKTTEAELSAWQERKKGVMQKIFSREVRFKADDGSEFPEWEEKKIGEICVINPKTEEVEDEFLYMDLGSVDHGDWEEPEVMIKSKAPSRAQRVARVDDVFFQSVRPYNQGHFHYSEKKDKQVVASTGYIQIRMKNCDSGFIYQILYDAHFNQEVSIRCTGSNYPAINADDFSEIVIAYPCVEEQRKIAECLSSLDDVINQIDAELSAWKEFKKGLLQQMFV